MIRIALVGDIGSGKSYVAKNFGYPVFNADIEVGKLYKKNRKIFDKLKKTMKQLSDRHISIEKIIDQKLIYETRWYMEKKEILYLKKLKQ